MSNDTPGEANDLSRRDFLAAAGTATAATLAGASPLGAVSAGGGPKAGPAGSAGSILPSGFPLRRRAPHGRPCCRLPPRASRS